MAVLPLAVEVQPGQVGRPHVELFGWDKRVHVLEQAVIEVSVATGIGNSVLQRRAARTATVEPGKSKRDQCPVGKGPRIEPVQVVSRAASEVLKQLRVAEGGLLGGAEVRTKAIPVQGVVVVLIGKRVGALVDATQ